MSTFEYFPTDELKEEIDSVIEKYYFMNLARHDIINTSIEYAIEVMNIKGITRNSINYRYAKFLKRFRDNSTDFNIRREESVAKYKEILEKSMNSGDFNNSIKALEKLNELLGVEKTKSDDNKLVINYSIAPEKL